MNDPHKNCLAINEAIKKYGKESFKKYFIVFCEEWELERLEVECIKKFRSLVSENGYNISLGGNAPMRGRSLSPEHIKKISGENNHGFGKRRPEETRKKISESQKGEKNNNFGKPIPKETREKISNALMGRVMSPESCKKMRENHPDFNGENNPNFGRKWKNASSPYFGVIRWTGGGYVYWRAKIQINKKEIWIGKYFKTELEAALAYDKYVRENNLPNPINFPQ
jgi:group I intron endonuclease